MAGLEYQDRLKKWGLTKLSERRVRSDLIQAYKCLRVKEYQNQCVWHTETGLWRAPESTTRSAGLNSQRLRGESFPSRMANDFAHFVSVRHNFFLNRVPKHWNKLTNKDLEAPTISQFKKCIDRVSDPTKSAAIAQKAQ